MFKKQSAPPVSAVFSYSAIRLTAHGADKTYPLDGDAAHQKASLNQLAQDASAPPFARNPVLTALRLALTDETMDSADTLFEWALSEAPDEVPCAWYWQKTPLAKAARRARWIYLGDVVYNGDLDPLSEKGVTPRSVILEGLWFIFSDWQSVNRLAAQEAFALALSKYYGHRGNIERAAFFIDRSLKVVRPTHLKSAEHALLLRLQGKTVPPRFEKFIGRDNGYLKNFVCDAPFKRFDLVETGEVNVCCGHWLPSSIGRIEEGTLESVLNSPKAQSIRRSMTDGSYKYCNQLECIKLAEGKIPRREEIADPVLLNAMATQDFKVRRVDDMLFAYDQSCNLACPSCRRDRIIEKPSQNEAKARVMEEKLLPLLHGLRHLMINVAGEVFASKPSRKILEMISPQTCPELEIDLISNGMLFTQAEWEKFPGIHAKVRGVRISIDAARRRTFEKLRRFGVYDILLKNLAFIKSLREQGIIRDFICSFTYQVGNFREMEEFVHFARAYGFDRATFEPLQNVGAFTDEEYRARAVHKPYHPLFPEFLEIIRRPVFSEDGVTHDFSNYEGFEETTPKAAG